MLIFWPYFFKEKGKTVTVNTDRYSKMLNNFDRPKLENADDVKNVWFMQDGRSIALAQELLPWFRCVVTYPGPHYPQIRTPAIFLGHSWRKKCFLRRTTESVMRRIRLYEKLLLYIASMPSKVRASFEKRLQSCVASNRAHMPNIMLKL